MSRRALVATGVAVVLMLANACAEEDRYPDTESRPYSSLEDMAAHSAVVVTGVVLDRHQEEGRSYARFEVDDAPSPPGLATAIDPVEVAAGDVIEVVEIGRGRGDEPPLLRVGVENLLFLTTAANGEFFITGAYAGIYTRNPVEPSEQYRSTHGDVGDDVPHAVDPSTW